MGKTKLTIAKGEEKKLESAAHFAGVELGDTYTLGKEVICEVTPTRDGGASFFKMGRLFETLDGTELDALKKAQADKKAAAEKAAAAALKKA